MGAALALALMPVGRAGAEAPGCDWAGSAFWKGAEPAQVDRCIAAGTDLEARGDKYGGTPLHWAARGGNPETVAALIDAGADLEARDKDGNTPADLAEDNPAVRDHAIFWTLNRARFD